MMNIFKILQQRLKNNVLIVGIGNPSCGDDAVGMFIVEKLVRQNNFTHLAVGDVPELYLHEIVKHCSDVIMFVDAVEMGKPPGSVALIEKQQLPFSDGNTHQPALSIILEYVSQRTGADTFLLGIQPENISGEACLSEPVESTMRVLSDMLNEIANQNKLLLTRVQS